MIFVSIAGQCRLDSSPWQNKGTLSPPSVSEPVRVEVCNHAISRPAGFVSVAIGVKPISYLGESILVYCLMGASSFEGDHSGE